MFTTSEDLLALPHSEVSVPSHASVSVVSAACAVDRPSITARVMTREQGRSIGKETAGPTLAAYHGRQEAVPTVRCGVFLDFPPPTRRLLAVRRRAVFVVLEGERPHPRLPHATTAGTA
jgi:hypothetical protein